MFSRLVSLAYVVAKKIKLCLWTVLLSILHHYKYEVVACLHCSLVINSVGGSG